MRSILACLALLCLAVMLVGCNGGTGGAAGPQAGGGSITGTAKVPGAVDNSGILVVAQQTNASGQTTAVEALRAGKAKPEQVGTAQMPGGATYSTRTDASGHFELKGLAEGTYAITASKEGTLAAVETAEVTSEAATQLDIVLTPTGSITGKAQVQGDTVHSGVIVFIPGTSYMAISDAAGNFTISNVPTGPRQLMAFRPYGPVKTGPSVTVIAGQAANAGTITVEAPAVNHAPTIDSISATPATLLVEDEETSLNAAATDVDGDTLTYQWTISPPDAGEFTLRNDRSTTKWKATKTGSVTARLHVEDNKGASAEQTINVNVQAKTVVVEPNDTWATAYPLSLGVKVWGDKAPNNPQDWMKLELMSDTALTLSLNILELWDYGNDDGRLSIFDSGDNSLKDPVVDTVYNNESGLRTYQLNLRGGTYYLRIRTAGEHQRFRYTLLLEEMQ